MLHWRPLEEPEPGFSIILGVPWDLRHLLPVNLEFVRRTDTTDLRQLHIIFDRRERPGAADLIDAVQRDFTDLPLTFRFYPHLSGRLVEKTNVSTFYNSMNTVLGLGDCTTRYAILHDFDLYPLVPNYFTDVVSAMRHRQLRFCGLETTPFDGLTPEDLILGTWCLGIDVQWLRANHRPIECFHKVAKVSGRLVNLDPYSYLQTKVPKRDLVRTIDGSACCHVKNLCSTYLRFVTGRWAKIVWRLHYVWYLEYLCGTDANFLAAMKAMQQADGSKLVVRDYDVDFAGTDPTCANVLRDELTRMETFLHGHCRPEVTEYVDAFEEFLTRWATSPTNAT
jgi:hypothetical protein